MTTTDMPAAPALTRFPFPFRNDNYRYSANIEPAFTPAETVAGGWGDVIIDLDEHYEWETAERARILAADPTRIATSDHMRRAEWDALLFCLDRMAVEHPKTMFIRRDGAEVQWINALLGVNISFEYGNDESVPGGPLAFLASQVQDDVVLLDEREGSLWLDSGVVTFAADWSMGFDVGMRFLEIHGPVPRIHEENIISRAHDFLLRMQPGEAYRRTNWTLTVDRRLDTSTETYPLWGPTRTEVLTDPGLPDRVHLRVEVQHLIKLPQTGAVMFLIRSHLQSLTALSAHEEWRLRLGHVLKELPEDMATYKGISGYRHLAADWLLRI